MKNQKQHKIVGAAMVVLLLALMGFKVARPYQMEKFTAPASADQLVNPLKGNAAATAEGKARYESNCVICHGAKGKGDGTAAAGLAKPPADHTSAAVQKLSDGALFWMLTKGNKPMPSYKDIYTDNQRWALVNYIRTFAKPAKK
jgi:mono/diheme cytochrome c family protein